MYIYIYISIYIYIIYDAPPSRPKRLSTATRPLSWLTDQNLSFDERYHCNPFLMNDTTATNAVALVRCAFDFGLLWGRLNPITSS